MFHQGDLQSGISLALQQSKSVTCFVQDDSQESKLWEDEWLRDEAISELLASKSVNLRLQAGSVEAGFLAAFCPIQKTPAILMVYNGQLRLSLFAGVEKEEFLDQLVKALKNEEVVQNSALPDETSNPEPAQTAVPAYTESEANTTLTSLLPDRAARLESERRRAAEAEAAARKAKAAGKRRAVEEETSQANQSSKMRYAAQEKLRKQAQQSELQRILDRVEADKRERREQAEMRRRLREAEASGSASPDVLEQQTSSTSRGPTSKRGDVCLRIRLLDGSQLRDYFAQTATLSSDVRPRIDAAIAPSTPSRAPPYTFKLLLAPQHPNRHLSAADETTPLKDLDDVPPSATLVLMPVRNAAAAYTGGGGGYIGSVYGALLAAYNLFASFLGTFFAPFARGGGSSSSSSSSSSVGSAAGAGGNAAGASSSAREGHAGGTSDGGAGEARNSSPAAAAASSSWSAKHRNVGGRQASDDSGSGSGSGFDGQADSSSRPATSAVSGSSSPIGGGGSGGLRIRTLRDRLGEDEGDNGRTEYYNGNSLGLDGDDNGGGDGSGGGGRD